MKWLIFLSLRKSFVLCIIFLNFKAVQGQNYTSKEILQLFNSEYKFDLNIFLWNYSNIYIDKEVQELLYPGDIPKILLNDLKANTKALREYATGNSLIIVYAEKGTFTQWLGNLDKLLWERHLSYILIIYKGNIKTPFTIFQKCWHYGFVNVLLWHQQEIYTYNPYPQVKPLKLQNFTLFQQRSYLKNFQHMAWTIPFIDFAPRCFSYINRQGKLIRTGYIFKIIELFIEKHNGTLDIYNADMWIANLSRTQALDILKPKGFHFLCNALFKDEIYASSDSLWLYYRHLIVPTDQEIPKSFYITKPFSGIVYIMILVLSLTVYLIIFLNNRFLDTKSSRSSLLESLAIIVASSYGKFRNRHKLFNILVVILKLFSALLLANYYLCSLSSLAVTKIYEPELKTLEDIAKTNLKFYEYTLDMPYYEQMNLPDIIYKRLITGNNTYMFYNRRNLNVHQNIFAAFEDVSNYYLLQQRYMRKRLAKLLDEPLYGYLFFLVVKHRLPIMDLLNEYLLRIKESGLVNKMIADSELDGILSDDIQFFADIPREAQLKVEHMKYVFIIFLMGLIVAIVCFIGELIVFKKVNII